MQWMDWSPRADVDYGGCRSYEIGISVGAVGITSTRTQCDTWDITKSEEAGSFRNDWRGNARQSDREVAYMQAVAVPQGGWPIWNLWTELEYW